ncbi:MAG: hypothetical protein NTU73_05880 [Ignavibacteriae bacterium]|nr:hypothetical protein [Ignavibacteriota bacterium]
MDLMDVVDGHNNLKFESSDLKLGKVRKAGRVGLAGHFGLIGRKQIQK